ncbi:aromatic-ring hydroxylase C-terminal domain-containing protein [Streptomyces sp. NPDC001073]
MRSAAGGFALVTPGAHDGKVYGTQGARRDRLAGTRWASGRRTAPLVRPDGYLAWAADTADPAAVETALVAHVG